MDEPPSLSTPSASEQRRTRVVLVFGGRSTEHGVSCVSAGSVLAALDRAAYDVIPVGITTEGRWVLVADEAEKLTIRGGTMPTVEESGTAVVLAGDPTAGGLTMQEPGRAARAFGHVDVVFPLLHGPYGEDGTIQGLLELAGVPYVGSGVFSSAAAMDKGHMKALLAAAGLPVGPHVLLTPREWAGDPAACLARVRAELALPVFVKPCRGGSSLGIVKVSSWSALGDAVEQARAHDPRVIVEQGIAGREIECGVLAGTSGGPAVASVLAEVRLSGDHEFYDFQAKYLDGAAVCDVPADLPGDVAAEMRALAVRAFDALACEGLARVDFFLADDGNVLVNEVNTMPGFTPTSMFPRMWAASGVDYPALVDRLLHDALRRGTGLR